MYIDIENIYSSFADLREKLENISYDNGDAYLLRRIEHDLMHSREMLKNVFAHHLRSDDERMVLNIWNWLDDIHRLIKKYEKNRRIVHLEEIGSLTTAIYAESLYICSADEHVRDRTRSIKRGEKRGGKKRAARSRNKSVDFYADVYDAIGPDDRSGNIIRSKSSDSYRGKSCRTPIDKSGKTSKDTTCNKDNVSKPDRYVDVSFYKDDDQEIIEDGSPLQENVWYAMEVAVRENPVGIPAAEGKRKEFKKLSEKKDHDIVVTIESKNFAVKESVQKLILPASGDSTQNALFRVKPLTASDSKKDLAEIIIRMYYEFSLIEVLRVRAEVTGELAYTVKSRLGIEKPVELVYERFEHDYVDVVNIVPRSMGIDITHEDDVYRFAFAFKNNRRNTVEFNASVALTQDTLEDYLVKIREALYDLTMSSPLETELDSNEYDLDEYLRALAKIGRKMWVDLFRYDMQSSMFVIGEMLEQHPLDEGCTIQISFDDKSDRGFVFPWAFLYDRKVPESDTEKIDPYGFWGYRYCLEQKLPGQYRSLDRPVSLAEGKKLACEFIVNEMFSNAIHQDDLLKELQKQSKDRFSVSYPKILSDTQCLEMLKTCDAQVLYFFTHGYTCSQRSPDLNLFIQKYEKLPSDSHYKKNLKFFYDAVKAKKYDLDKSWIEPSQGKLVLSELYENITERLKSAPFVFLNMCQSVSLLPSARKSFIHFFLNRGAKSVLGTECSMTEVFAHPFSRLIMTELLKGRSIGQALLNARLYFLKKHKNPLGLAYSLYGNATFRLESALLDDEQMIQNA